MSIKNIIKKIFFRKSNAEEATPLVQTRREWSEAIVDDTKASHAIYDDSVDVEDTKEDYTSTDSY